MDAIDDYRYQKLQDQIDKLRCEMTIHTDLIHRHEYTIANILVENEKLNRLLSERDQCIVSLLGGHA